MPIIIIYEGDDVEMVLDDEKMKLFNYELPLYYFEMPGYSSWCTKMLMGGGFMEVPIFVE